MSLMKFCAVISSFTIVCWAAENKNIDEFQYKNHRVSKNDTQNSLSKFSTYPSQVYADLSNFKNYSTETPLDSVRLYITPTSKRKTTTTIPQVQVQGSTLLPASKNVSPPMYYVTASNAAYTPSNKDNRGPVFSPSFSDSLGFQTSIVTEDEPKRQLKFNGTKSRNVQKTPNQAQTHLLYATTQSPLTNYSKDPTTFAITTKSSSNNVSKPFATVLVPKQILEGNVQNEYLREDSAFRPIVPPTFSYKQNTDSNSIDNRKSVNAAKTENTLKSNKQGFVKAPVSYKVEENVPSEQLPSVAVNKMYNTPDIKQDRFGSSYAPGEKSMFDRVSDQTKVQEISGYNFPKQDTKYEYMGSDSFMYEKQFSKPSPYSSDKYREFYSATEGAPPKESYLPYNSAGRLEMSKSPPSFDYEKKAILQSSPSSWFAPTNSETEFKDPEFSMGEVSAKNMLKSLLRDMIISKQQSETKLKTSGINEFSDSYFKTNRPNVDFSLDNYDIETDMSCNLRSSKYITDGQCVTTKPIVEAVCADRCLVYSPSQLSIRQRLSHPPSQQVEALHCVEGDTKFVRIQLKCRDGNVLNNVIKVVTNCRCKLHQIQPQMRSNSMTPLL